MILGNGHLGRAVATALRQQGAAITDQVPVADAVSLAEDSSTSFARGADVCLLAVDTVDASQCLAVNAATTRAGIPLLPALAMGQVAQVGPRLVAGQGPCLQCIDLRVQANIGRPALAGPFPVDVALPEVAAELLVDMATGAEPDDALVYLWSDGRRTSHHVLRTLACPACAEVDPRPPWTTARRLDLKDGESDPDRIRRLEHLVVDNITGVVRSVRSYEPGPDDPQVGHVVASVADPAWAALGQEINAGGSDPDPNVARAAALGEALDRLATSDPGPPHRITASHAAVLENAVDPAAFDVFDPETRKRPGFPYACADADTPRSWVWALSLGQRRPLLVPAALVFVPFTSDLPGDRADPSNVSGAATGSTRAEAALGGLLEVAERDTFMIAWATGVPVTGLRVGPDSPGRVGPFARAFADRGMDVRCATVTLDWGIPVVIAIARSTSPGEPGAVVSAAAGVDVVHACGSALRELTANMLHVRGLLSHHPSPHPGDPASVRTQEAHALLYARQDMAETLAPWWDPDVVQDLPPTSTAQDAAMHLDDIVGRITGSGQDVLVVDLSLPGLGEAGLHTIKVLVTGSHPINFDSLWPQVGGPRMRSAPVAAGLLDRPPHTLNLSPHPFP